MTTQLSEPVGARQAPPDGRLRRLALGSAEDPRWTRPALWAVLALATALYAWGLSGGGYANDFYSAAVKSGAQSWKAFFFGSLDAGSFITVDKPPMALWVQEIFARIMGFGTWSLLLPEVITGVAAIAVVYATVRRAFGPVAGVIAALVMTLTPITVAINRDNNPDTLLVLLLALAAWACQRALESGRLRWLLASAFFLGCGFNTKMLQAYILLPALALAYLLFAHGGLLRRIGHLLAAGVVLAVSSFWWMVIVDLIPASRRPYIGGSTDGTAWNLVIGYNGIGRITGNESGGPGGGGPGGGRGGPGGGGGFSGQSGIGRMFNDVLGGQISWLLPLAAIALVAGLVLYWRRPRTDLARAALVMWGGWLALHFVVFSFASGIMHPYYTTAMAPGIAALTGIGAVELTRARRRGGAWPWVLPVGVAVTGAWAFVLLGRTPDWNPWLAWVIAGLTVVAVIGLLATRLGPGALARFGVLAAVAGLVAGLAGPAAFAVSAAGGHANGSNPTAGPNSGGMGFPGMRGGMPGGGQLPAAIRQRIEENGGFRGGFPGGGEAPGGAPGGSASGGRAAGRLGGPGGGPGMGGEPNSQMISYLEKNQGDATWLVAVSNSQSAASLILQTGKPVISMFGFGGSDRAMTAQKLQELVKAGKLHYVMTGGGFGGRGGPDGGGNSDVTSWVTKNCTAVKSSEYGGSTQSNGSTETSGSSLYRCG
ncbi:glycosyltransferase family 39 protein [Actinoallomurus rhizosphaericola]|uniref:glycosyltransferase family 39 protein n=1 Tax=Actinoallomurus rhizosphaericola TaxID=2952536 RepID=UPI00209137C6|nr:glycosyltransferase family 39 protein [Actinoallomurus rhizosphaericola]MCO5992420.1 glycosyltransferase family 39 protein [Actinoallomurus rhizosphaericola]